MKYYWGIAIMGMIIIGMDILTHYPMGPIQIILVLGLARSSSVIIGQERQKYVTTTSTANGE